MGALPSLHCCTNDSIDVSAVNLGQRRSFYLHLESYGSTTFRSYQELVPFVQYYIAVVTENRWDPPLVFDSPPLSRQRCVDGA